MSDLSSLVSEDSRTPIQRLRRCALWKIADEEGITYPDRAPKTTMISLLEASGIDVTRSQVVKWNHVSVQNEQGGSHLEAYPVVPEHATARQNIDYDAIISEKAKENEQKDEVIEEQSTALEILQKRLEALENNQPVLPLDAMLPWQLKRLCKEQGIKTNNKSTKLEMIEWLGG